MHKIAFSHKLEVLINEKVDELVNKSTCQLFLEGGKFQFMPLGSGLLLKLQNHYFILTAAHVAEEFDNSIIYLMTPKGEFYEVRGEIQMTVYQNKGKFDVASIRISKPFGEFLSNYFIFLGPDNILLSHKLIDGNNYSVFGYPARNVKLVGNKLVSTKASLYILKPSKLYVYDYYNFDKNKFYILEFKGRGISLKSGKRSEKFGRQNGLSGCGLLPISTS